MMIDKDMELNNRIQTLVWMIFSQWRSSNRDLYIDSRSLFYSLSLLSSISSPSPSPRGIQADLMLPGQKEMYMGILNQLKDLLDLQASELSNFHATPALVVPILSKTRYSLCEMDKRVRSPPLLLRTASGRPTSYNKTTLTSLHPSMKISLSLFCVLNWLLSLTVQYPRIFTGRPWLKLPAVTHCANRIYGWRQPPHSAVRKSSTAWLISRTSKRWKSRFWLESSQRQNPGFKTSKQGWIISGRSSIWKLGAAANRA